MEYFDSFAFLVTLPIVIKCNFYWLKRTKKILNPVVITSLFFWLPSGLYTLKLSYIQTTYSFPVLFIVISFSMILIIVPTILLKFSKLNIPFNNITKITPKSISFLEKLFITMTIVFFVSYLIENKISFDRFIPIYLIKEEYLKGYGSYSQIFSYFNTLMQFTVPIFTLFLYNITGKKKTLLFFLVSILLPITRGTRTTALIFFLMFGFIFISSKKVNFKRIKIILVIALILLFLFFNEFIQETRSGRIYANLIGMSDKNIITRTFSTYYGYICMSFDVFQRSFDSWINSGMEKTYFHNLSGTYYLLQLDDFFPSLPNLSKIQKQFYSRVTGAVALPTALSAFIFDFGILASFFYWIVLSLINFFVFKLSLKTQYIQPLFLAVMMFNFFIPFYSLFLSPGFVFVLIVSGYLYIYSKKRNKTINTTANNYCLNKRG